jgi:hypothetical protein
MNCVKGIAFALFGTGLVASSLCYAQSSTRTYAYDALGRLTAVTVSGGQNNGEAHSICYDSAGNRTQYGSTSNGVLAACAGSALPPPPPPPPLPPPPPPPSSSGLLSINDAQANEGGALVFTVSLSAAQSTTVSVSYATAVGTAGTTDFTAVSGVLQFSAGQTSKMVSVATINNTIVEATETLSLNLSNATGPASISDVQGIGTIFDDDISGGGEPPPDGANCGEFLC